MLTLVCYAFPAMAAEAIDPETALHGQQRPQSIGLGKDGLALTEAYTGDIMRIFSGSVNGRRSAYLDSLDLGLTADTNRWLKWPGGTLFIDGLLTRGGLASGRHLTGDLQGANNIEAPNHFILYEAWYEQRFANDRASLLFGLHNMDSEFYVSDDAGLFLNSSFGTGPEIALNVNSPIYPRAGLGIRGRVQPLQNWYIQGGVYDGNPATRALKGSEGKMLIIENGFSGTSGAYKAGYWQHTANKSYNNQTFNNDYGVYAIIDQQLMRFEGSTAIGGFVQWGWVPKARNDVTGYLGFGLHIQAPFSGRNDDELGIALARASTHASAETTAEVTYRVAVNPWIAIQPSLQWIRHPGGNATAKTAKVGLLRFQITM